MFLSARFSSAARRVGLVLGLSCLAACTAPQAPRDGNLDARADGSKRTASEPIDSPSSQDVPSSRDIPSPTGLGLDGERQMDRAVRIDGSSTVFPISEAVAGLYERENPSIPVLLGVSGTGGGFEKFCQGEIDIADASRPIKTEEKERCRKHGIELVEVPVAFDGISVVTHRDNHWSSCLTVDELARLWSPDAEGRGNRWSELRPDWPDRPVHLFGPGTDSGTYDYFTHAVLGKEGRSRLDFSASEDDYLLAQDIADAPGSLGFFGFAYYREYQDRLRLVAVDQGTGCIEPSEESIAQGRYRPLSRPLFLYVQAEALQRPEVRRFIDLYLSEAPRLVPQVGYVPLPARAYQLARERVAAPRLGSIFDGGSQVGVSIESLLEAESRAAP